jgi:putative transcriptional regulator
MRKIADGIRRGLRQAVAYADGKADESGYRVHVPAKTDVKALLASAPLDGIDLDRSPAPGRDVEPI